MVGNIPLHSTVPVKVIENYLKEDCKKGKDIQYDLAALPLYLDVFTSITELLLFQMLY